MKTKKILLLILSLALIFSALTLAAFAESSSEALTDVKAEATGGTAGDCTWTLDGTKLTVSGNGMLPHYSSFFSAPWGTDVTEVVIQNGVTLIGDYCFRNCTKLSSVSIPASVSYISDSAFSGCSALASLTVANGNADYHSKGNCIIRTASKNLILGSNESVIPSDGSVTLISGGAFRGRKGLTSIVIPNSVTQIADWAFAECSGLTSFVIPDSVTYLGSYAFYQCTSLASVTVSGSLTSIQSRTFYECKALGGIVIPKSVKSIQNDAFQGCTSLESLTVENGNETYYSEGNCIIKPASKALVLGCKNSVIPADGSVTTIGSHAFNQCTGLSSIVIPASVKTIDGSAFIYCSNLKTVYYSGSEDQKALIAVGSDNSYLTNAKWLCNYCGVGKCTFDAGCDPTCNVCFAERVDTTDAHDFDAETDLCKKCHTHRYLTFENNTEGGLTVTKCDKSVSGSLVIPACVNGKAVTAIGNSAFQYLYSLRNVVIPDTVTLIGANAFGSSGLQSITIGASVKTIGASAFSACYGLQRVYYTGEKEDLSKITIDIWNDMLPKTDAWICICGEGKCVYSANCDLVCDVCFLERSEALEAHDFDEETDLCKKCKSHHYLSFLQDKNGGLAVTKCDTAATDAIIIPETVNGIQVTRIEGGAFYQCKKIKSVSIPDSVTSIGSDAFGECTALESINVPASILFIEKYAFADCAKLKTIALPQSIQYLSSGTFSGCKALKSIVIPATLEFVEGYTFEGCTKLADVWYEGSEAQRGAMEIESENAPFLSATWHYSTCKGGAHTFANEDDTTCENCEWVTTPPYTPGDLDGVEGVSSADAIYLLYYTLFGEERYPVNQPVDYDKNDSVNSADAIYLLYHTLFGEERYPL